MSLKDANIMITGGTGSFGRYMTSELLKHDVRKVVIFSRDEEKQLDMSREIEDDRVVYIIGDVRDEERLKEVTKDIDILYHAAALKIISTAEEHPEEVIKTNVLGTRNVVKACLKNNVELAVLISTDKAVKPINLYGMTKAIAEKIWIDASFHGCTNFPVVRYGNVIGSRGSIVPFFKKLYEMGKPIPITDLGMTRFLITLGEAIDLVIRATERGRDILVPNIRSAYVTDIVKAITGAEDYPIFEIGIRKGEKVHECLINEYEIRHTCISPDGSFYIINEDFNCSDLKKEFTSLNDNMFTVKEIKEVLTREGF